MSVYLRKGSPFYQYEFQIQGARFRGSTGETKKRSAEQAEARIRAEVAADLKIGTARTRETQMTLGDAVTRFWLEKGEHEANSATVWYQLENLVDGLGKNKLLSQIGMSDLAEYQAKRRGQKNRRGKLPSNRSINAEVPELIRRIYTRAAELWSDDARAIALGPARKWADLKLRVPKGRTRELHADEEERLWEKLRVDYADVIEFAMITGLRRAALIIRWDQVDLEAGVIRYVRKSLHDNDIGILPISDRMRQLIVGQRGRHRTYVWTYIAKRTKGGKTKGRRYPITEEGLKTTMRRAVNKAGIADWRVIHDLRHTAATRTLRSSKNLKAVQSMLGHSGITSTVRYAHVLIDDVREALDATSPRKSPTIVKKEVG